MITFGSSRCTESQREAALLLGQFATTDPECKVSSLVPYPISTLLLCNFQMVQVLFVIFHLGVWSTYLQSLVSWKDVYQKAWRNHSVCKSVFCLSIIDPFVCYYMLLLLILNGITAGTHCSTRGCTTSNKDAWSHWSSTSRNGSFCFGSPSSGLITATLVGYWPRCLIQPKFSLGHIQLVITNLGFVWIYCISTVGLPVSWS